MRHIPPDSPDAANQLLPIKHTGAPCIILDNSVIALYRTFTNLRRHFYYSHGIINRMAKYSEELKGVARALYLRRYTPKEIASELNSPNGRIVYHWAEKIWLAGSAEC